MGKVKVCTENSRSKSGLHKRRTIFFVLGKGCDFVDPPVIKKYGAEPTYVNGSAECFIINVPADTYVVLADFRMNPKTIIKGDLRVLDWDGVEVGRAVYRKLKVRVTQAISEEVLDFIKCVFRKLKLPVKRYGIIHGGIKG